MDWLIIGGGIHGVHIAARLIGEASLDAAQIRILDPAPALLARWRSCTASTGMSHLRSPSVHHLDLDPWSLQRFAGPRRRRRAGLFAAPYDRPALDLFNAHCDRVIQAHGLQPLHIQDWASACHVDCDGVQVTTAGGAQLRAQQVVLALGAGETPAWPGWAPCGDPRVQHIFARDFALPAANDGQCIAVVGGGISAAQLAL
ncbi:MAG: FAD/NAD(P)-binding protein, partial [Polyangiales bacterium]